MVKNKCDRNILTPMQMYYCEMWDGEVETVHKQAADDNNLLGSLLITGAIILGAYSVGRLLDDAEKRQIQEEIQNVYSTAPDELKSRIEQTAQVYNTAQEIVLPETPIEGSIYSYLIQSDSYSMTQAELTQYQNLMEGLKHETLASNLADPRTVENIAFRNAQSIQEKIGSFGALEAEKQGRLSVWKAVQDAGHIVLIPWETMGDEKVCDDCYQTAEEGPYPPDEFPAPLHFLDRCYDGEPILELSNVQMP
jgi:hypothetical protein